MAIALALFTLGACDFLQACTIFSTQKNRSVHSSASQKSSIRVHLNQWSHLCRQETGVCLCCDFGEESPVTRMLDGLMLLNSSVPLFSWINEPCKIPPPCQDGRLFVVWPFRLFQIHWNTRGRTRCVMV